MPATHEAIVPAMGSTAHLVLVGGDARLLPVALARLAQLERRWSRFLADSEVSRHNAALACGATPPEVSIDTQRLFEAAAEGHRMTSGRFDPYRLAAVTAAGYRTSLRAPDGDEATASPPNGSRRFADAPLAPQVGFDPGGIGKGLAADFVSAELMAAGAAGVLVGIGGDVRVRGCSPEGGAWRIDIEDPREHRTDGRPLATVELTDGAVATSSRCKRRWTAPDGSTRHHLIDPRTGVPAATPTLQATVIAAEGWQAEVLTKVAFLEPIGAPLDRIARAEAGLELIETLGAAALVVTESLVEPSARWHRFDRTPVTSGAQPGAHVHPSTTRGALR